MNTDGALNYTDNDSVGYIEDIREKNSIAKSTRIEAHSNGLRNNRLPTKKEYDEKCSPVKTYNLARPMSWTEFKRMPDDLQREYIRRMQERFKVSNAMLRKMFAVSDMTITRMFMALGINNKVYQKTTKHEREYFAKKWDEFLSGGETPAPEFDAVKLAEADPQPVSTASEQPGYSSTGAGENGTAQVEQEQPEKAPRTYSGTVTIKGELAQVFERLYNLIGSGEITCTVEF